MSIFVLYPWLALVTGSGLSALWFWRRCLPVGIAAIAWLGYGVYEYLMLLRVLCSGECNIRVDLLAIYPALLALTAWAVVRLIKQRGPRGDAA